MKLDSLKSVWSKKGFTIIELMIVIAIITLISGGILVSLGTSKGKGNNAAVKTSFAQMRTEANLYINTNDNYGTAPANGGVNSCNTPSTMFVNDTRFAAILAKAQASTGYVPKCMNTIGSAGAWASTIQFSTPDAGTNNYLCVDSLGTIKGYVADPMPVTVCP